MPWRMGARDYVKAAHVGMPRLTGSRGVTPWDPSLAEVMAETGLEVHEEAVLSDLLDDLRARGG